MTVCSGPSGSGKSSLAIDTLYAEGQRRYVESLSSYARQFLAPLQKPKVEQITGLSPAVCIEQKTTSKSPRSTVGTVTEIHDYWRILFARLGQPHCPKPAARRSARRRPTRSSRRSSTCPRGRRSTSWPRSSAATTRTTPRSGTTSAPRASTRVRVDGVSTSLDAPPKLSHRRKHRIEVVIDRAIVRRSTRSRLADSVEAALDLGKGVVHVARVGDEADEARWPSTATASTGRATAAAGASRSSRPTTSRSTARSAGARVCEGLGTQQGANPAALIPDGRLSIREGAVIAWPDFADRPPSPG